MTAAKVAEIAATNPLIDVLVKAGLTLRYESVLSGSYYMSNGEDDLLLIHPPNDSLAITTIPVEVIA